MADDAAYCSATQIRYFIGRNSADTKNDALITAIEPMVRAAIDQAAGTWFNQRSKTIHRKASTAYQKKLFMPAPIISVTSLTELDNVLTATEYLIGNCYFEKANGQYWTTENYERSSVLKYGVQFIGKLGYATVPSDIAMLAADMCAVLSGLKVKTYTTGDGIQQTVNLTTLPDYLKQALHSRTRIDLSGQQMQMATTV